MGVSNLIIDTGALVAVFDPSEGFHASCAGFLRNFEGRIITTEAILTESLYMLGNSFENQKKWEGDKNAGEIFIKYAEDLGLNTEQFKQDRDSKEVKDKVEADYQSGVKAGVNHTPTFFINGKEIQNPRSYEEFKNIINEAESKKS